MAANGKKLPKASETAIGDESDSDVPINRKLASEKKKIQQKGEQEAATSRKQDTAKTTKAAASTAGRKKQTNGVKKEPEDQKAPAKKPAAKKIKTEPKSEQSTPVKKGKAVPVKKEESAEAEEGEEEEEYRWWEDPTKGDGTIKWTTLEHNGVVFPPPYEPLPKNVKMKYDGVPVTLAPEAEEVAGFFGDRKSVV